MSDKREIVTYNKGRVNKAGLGPRDRQLKVRKEIDSSPDKATLELKGQVLELREELLNMRSIHSAESINNVKERLYTEKEFNTELIKALDKELKQGTVNKSSVEHEQLKEDYVNLITLYEELRDVNISLEKDMLIKDKDLMSLQVKVDNFDILIASKDETIKSLKDKPIILESSKPEIVYVQGNNSQPVSSENNFVENHKIDIEVETIDPTIDTKLVSHLKVKEVKGTTSKEDMKKSLDKLRNLGLGGK